MISEVHQQQKEINPPHSRTTSSRSYTQFTTRCTEWGLHTHNDRDTWPVLPLRLLHRLSWRGGNAENAQKTWKISDVRGGKKEVSKTERESRTVYNRYSLSNTKHVSATATRVIQIVSCCVPARTESREFWPQTGTMSNVWSLASK